MKGRARSVLEGGGLAVAVCTLVALVSLVALSPSPPPATVAVAPAAAPIGPPTTPSLPPTTVPATTNPPTTATPTTTTARTSVVAPIAVPAGPVSGPIGSRPATATQAAAVAFDVPAPGGHTIATVTVSLSDPAWAVESLRQVAAVPRSAAGPDTLAPIANVLVEDWGGIWRKVDVGRPLVNCPSQITDHGVTAFGEAPNQVTVDLAAFLNPCG